MAKASSTHPGVSEIVKKYKAYCAVIFEVYEDYLFQQFYLPQIHNSIKKGTLPIVNHESIYTGHISPFRKPILYGVISRQERKIIGQRALLDSVSATENFLQQIAFRVYRDFEYKLEAPTEVQEQQTKLMRIILDSTDRTEMIRKIAEEKIRGIFYGNPADFFEKDKARLGFGTYFKDNYKAALEVYKEIIARRNIYTHNSGRVDRKYLKEVRGATFNLDEKLPIIKDYIKESIFLLHGFSSIVVEQVIKKTYSAPKIKEGISEYIKIFDKKYKGK